MAFDGVFVAGGPARFAEVICLKQIRLHRHQHPLRRAVLGAQFQSMDGERVLPWFARGRHHSVIVWRPRAPDHAVDHRPQEAATRGVIPVHRLSETRWRAGLRSSLLGVFIQHQPQREPFRSLQPESRIGAHFGWVPVCHHITDMRCLVS